MKLALVTYSLLSKCQCWFPLVLVVTEILASFHSGVCCEVPSIKGQQTSDFH